MALSVKYLCEGITYLGSSMISRLWKPSFTITLVRLYIFGDEVGNRLSNFLARYDSELGGNFIILLWPNEL